VTNLRCDLCPHICELGVCWTTLPDYLVIEARIVVDIYYTVCPSRETSLYELVVLGDHSDVEGTDGGVVVYQKLPAYSYIQGKLHIRDRYSAYAVGISSVGRP
jgi:hypothetical protein